jgi:hypothetical protein
MRAYLRPRWRQEPVRPHPRSPPSPPSSYTPTRLQHAASSPPQWRWGGVGAHARSLAAGAVAVAVGEDGDCTHDPHHHPRPSLHRLCTQHAASSRLVPLHDGVGWGGWARSLAAGGVAVAIGEDGDCTHDPHHHPRRSLHPPLHAARSKLSFSFFTSRAVRAHTRATDGPPEG